MAIFGSEEESFFDTLLLYLYQTIVLACLAAAGFIFYLFRTRAPLKEEASEQEGDNQRIENGQVAEGNATTGVTDDEILLRSALLDQNAGFAHGFSAPFPENGYSAPPPPPPIPAFRSKKRQEEEEEEEEDGPVPTKQPAIRQMVTTRHGVQEETVTNYPSTYAHNTAHEARYTKDTGYEHQPPQDYYGPPAHYGPPQGYANPPQFVNAGIPDALKTEAKKRIGQAIQKQQIMEWVAGGEFDEAITNIRAASQRLQNSDY